MLHKSHRLTSTYEFNKTRRLGKKYTSHYFHIFFLAPRNYKGPTKIGIVISNKFHKSAVKRNRVKRVFREVVRANLPKIKPNLWVVIHPKFSTLNTAYEKINTDFIKALQTLPIAA